MMKNSFISFIDVLGTRDIAKYDAERYYDLMYKFQSVLIEAAESLTPESSIRTFFFSDCAYIQSFDLVKLINFIITIRDELIKKEVYLKGAITNGNLGVDNDLTNPQKILYKRAKKLKDKLQGRIFFSGDISRVYGYQENLKGIGVFIDKSIIASNRKQLDKYLVKSFYLPDVNSNNVLIYTDIKYTTKDYDGRAIERIFQNYLMSNTKSKRYGRMFLSIVAALINSDDFSKTFYDDNSDKFVDSPIILEILINLSKRLPHLYSTAKGISFIYLLLINKVYSDKKDDEDKTAYHLASKIIKMSRFISRFSNNFDSIPDDIMESKNKTRFINDIMLMMEMNFAANKK